MEQRNLGGSGLKVPPLCFGGNVFGWTANQTESFSLLDALLDAGYNFIDTADMYSNWVPGNSGGESEAIIGHWLKSRGVRDRVVIATKVGGSMGDGKSGLSASYIKTAVDESLRRLKTEYIDLYQSHTDDISIPLEETLGAFSDLIEAGKVRAIGASNYDAERFEEALGCSKLNGLASYTTVQPLYNLMERATFEEKLQQLCLSHQIGVIPYYSLASGFLTGKYRTPDDLARHARGAGVAQYLDARGLKVLGALDRVASEYDTSPTAVALAWLMSQSAITAPIVSASSVDQLGELIKAAHLTLGSEAMQLLDDASR